MGAEAFFSRSAKNVAKLNPGKPGFRRGAPEMRPNSLKNFCNINLSAGREPGFTGGSGLSSGGETGSAAAEWGFK
jgi:hypothetical protein